MGSSGYSVRDSQSCPISWQPPLPPLAPHAERVGGGEQRALGDVGSLGQRDPLRDRCGVTIDRLLRSDLML
jgi:hypothetical protein